MRCNRLLKRGATPKWGKLAPSLRVAAQIGPYFVLALSGGLATDLGLGLVCPELLGPIHARNAIHSGSVNRPYFPLPSVSVTIRSTPGTVNCSTFPLGQCTSIASTVVACPKPKCGRGSFVDI